MEKVVLRPFSEGDGACGNQLDVVKRVFVCLDTHIDFMVGYAYLVLADAVVNPQRLIGYSPDDVLQMGQLSDVSLQQYPIVTQPLSGEWNVVCTVGKVCRVDAAIGYRAAYNQVLDFITVLLYDFLLELIRVGNTAEHNLEADTQYEQEWREQADVC